MGSRRLYGEEFKDQAVRLVKDTGDRIPSIATDLGISAVNLRRENKKLKAERDILNEATVDSIGHRNRCSRILI